MRNGNGIDYTKDDKVDVIRLQIYNGINENNGNDGLSEVDKMFVRFFRNFFLRRGLSPRRFNDWLHRFPQGDCMRSPCI